MTNENKPELRPGRYRHYKGSEYEVIGVARHSETGAFLVVYKAMYETKDGFGALSVRPYEMFVDEVEIDGATQPRFVFVGEEA